jgi:ribonucleoside-diphosphate reductase alpha chain
MNAFATAISLGLQHGVPLETFVRKFSHMRFEPEGITRNPEIPFAKSLPDYLMRWLASRFIDDTETLESLGILTEEIRAKREAQQALPIDEGNGSNGGGNGHSSGGGNGQSNGEANAESTEPQAEAKPAAAALTETPPVHPAAIEGLELGPACDQCGGMMQRTGSCYTCSSCGNNTGCG